MNAKPGWFEVDRAGLARLAARRNKRFILRELIQNAWDEAATEIDVEIRRVPGTPFAAIVVTDDSPEGFADLSHAYTLFAESKKLADAEKRGRFNLGEKLVLALCSEASVATTTGTIYFEAGEKRRRSKEKRAAGSVFSGKMRINAEELDDLVADARRLIPPPGKRTSVNGAFVEPRTPLRVIADVSLQTEIAKDDGALSLVRRATSLSIYETEEGEEAMLFEMGIPVVPTGDRWHVDVGQKVPVNMERDNVSPAYLREVRVAVANETSDLLTVEDANSTWARDALADDAISPAAAEKLTSLRFGANRVIFDPSDPEANALAITKGYTVVHGSQLNASEWSNVKRHATMLPAGQVTPSPKPFSADGAPLKLLPEEKWSDGMRRFVRLARDVARGIIGTEITVQIANDRGWGFAGCYGSRRLIVNAGSYGRAWFDETATAGQLRFLIHEFGHQIEGNHLSENYHEALCKLGAALGRLAIEKPEVFR